MLSCESMGGAYVRVGMCGSAHGQRTYFDWVEYLTIVTMTITMFVGPLIWCSPWILLSP